MIRDSVFTVADILCIILYICSLGYILLMVHYFVFILCLSVHLSFCLYAYCVYELHNNNLFCCSTNSKSYINYQVAYFK